MSDLQDAVASIPRRAERTVAIYRAHVKAFEDYHAAMPLALFVAAAQWESDGKMSAPGSQVLGEIGIYQVSEHTETEYGVPPGTRTTLEGNTFLAGLDYNCEARRLQVKYPAIYGMASPKDLWLGARSVFAIGRGGFDKVLQAANPSPGDVAGQISRWAAAGGVQRSLPGGLGSQSAAKVAYRIQVVTVLWDVAVRSGLSMASSSPYLPPAFVPFSVPKDLAGKISKPSSTFAAVVLAVAGIWWWLKGRKA